MGLIMLFVIDFIGWAGMITALAAYALVSMKKIQAQEMTYQCLNIFGGLCLTINAVYYGSMPIAALEGIWAAIGMAMVYFIFKRKNYGR